MFECGIPHVFIRGSEVLYFIKRWCESVRYRTDCLSVTFARNSAPLLARLVVVRNRLCYNEDPLRIRKAGTRAGDPTANVVVVSLERERAKGRSGVVAL